MILRIATIDASPLIALYDLDLLDKVSMLFHRIHIPGAVKREISRKRLAQRHKIAALLRASGLFQRCQVGNSLRIDLLVPRKLGKPYAHRGEAEAVIQAWELEAWVIVDDPLGRKWAQGHSLKYHGTVWILEQLRLIGVIAELRPLFETLRRKGHRLPWDEVNAILRGFGEEELSTT